MFAIGAEVRQSEILLPYGVVRSPNKILIHACTCKTLHTAVHSYALFLCPILLTFAQHRSQIPPSPFPSLIKKIEFRNHTHENISTVLVDKKSNMKQEQHQQQDQREQDEEQKQRRKRSIQRRRRMVKFSSSITRHEIPNINCYTKSQRQSMWYQKHEYREMTNYTTNSSYSNMEHDNESHSDRTTKDGSDNINDTRALGLITLAQSRQRRDRIQRAHMVVFREQQLQWEEGIDDAELLADVYFDATSHCQFLAGERGSQLAQHVQRLNDNETKLRIAKKRMIRLVSLSPTSSAATSTSSSSLSSPSMARRSKKSCLLLRSPQVTSLAIGSF